MVFQALEGNGHLQGLGQLLPLRDVEHRGLDGACQPHRPLSRLAVPDIHPPHRRNDAGNVRVSIRHNALQRLLLGHRSVQNLAVSLQHHRL